MFQSAPRVLLRGDIPQSSGRLLHLVSIRAPRSSAGRPAAVVAAPELIKFQSAPRVLLRGDKGEGGNDDFIKVSIRAPRSSAGRRARTNGRDDHGRFQSAPRVLLRGDIAARLLRFDQIGFNPRPAFFCGATTWEPIRAAEGSRFNPRPAFFCGATGDVVVSGDSFWVSIRAPRSSAGRRFRFAFIFTGISGFNPRPAFFCGATRHPRDVVLG